MRNAFADEITEIGTRRDDVILLSGDIGNKLFDKYKQNCESRFLNCGVAEANMVGVATGMALSGLRPVIYTITPFTTTRCYEQIRVDICYHNVPVIIVGTGSGLSYAELGPTHHSCEDMAILRVLPGMTVLAPCDSAELRLLLRESLDQKGPVYIRIGKKGEPEIHSAKAAQVKIGLAARIREGCDICLLAAGTVMIEALKAADILAARGISMRIESFHTIKPLDEECLLDAFTRFPVVAVCEEHSCLGGLAGSIAEWRCRQKGTLADIIGFGVPDEFMHEVGSQSYARKKYGFDAQSIAARLAEALHI